MSARRLLASRNLLLLPSGLILLAFFLIPVSYFFVVSFWRVRAYKLRPDATLDQYAAVLAEYGAPLLYTFGVALAIAFVVTVIAYAFAFYCRFRAQRSGVVLLFVALLTLFGGYLTKIYTWKTILGSEGILNSALVLLGLTDEPITAFLFNPVAVVITLVHYTLPIAVLPIYGSLRSIDSVPLEAARDLGAGPWRAFVDVVLPQSRPGVIAAFSLTFLFAAGDYVVPTLVGGPHTSMIGVFIQSQFGHRLNAPLGSAMSFTVIAVSVLAIGAFAAGLTRLTRVRPR
jgi:spermidine/putrescine transport system permease protein